MDLRFLRTKKNIINAFIELRAKKALEKITVKELSDIALINKATFYSHYKDIYDLSEQLEKESIESVFNDIPHPEYLVTNPKLGIIELTSALFSQSHLFNILFSESRSNFFAKQLESALKNNIFKNFPEFANNLEIDILLSVLIQGGFHAFLSHSTCDNNKVIDILGNISECLCLNYKQ